MDLSNDAIRNAPKVLLHDHLDGGLRPSTVVDLAASYEVNRWLTATARVENATDQQYEPADGFEAPGRGYFCGVKVRF